jgi:hypothetical protein
MRMRNKQDTNQEQVIYEPSQCRILFRALERDRFEDGAMAEELRIQKIKQKGTITDHLIHPPLWHQVGGLYYR